MENVRPGQWLVLVSGALLFVFSFMTLFDALGEEGSAWEEFGVFTWPGLLGLLCAVVMAAVVFGNASLPGPILTFTVPQLLVVAAFTAALIQLGLALLGLLSDFYDPGVGLWLSAIAAAGLLAGTVMEQEGGPMAGPSSTPPSPF